MSNAQEDPIVAMAKEHGGWEALARHLYPLIYGGTGKFTDDLSAKRTKGRPKKHQLHFWLAAKEAIARLTNSRRCHNQEVAAEEVIRMVRHYAEIRTAEANGEQPSYLRIDEVKRLGIADILDQMLDQDPIGLRIGETGEAVWDSIEYHPSVPLTTPKSFIKRMNEHTKLPEWLNGCQG